MKKIYKFLALCVLPLVAISCNKFLDEVPDNRAELTSTEMARQLLTTAYPQVSHYMAAEISSDNTTDNGSIYDVSYRQIQEYYLWQDVTPIVGDTPYEIWEGYYNNVATANHALEYIEKQADQEALAPYKAEALLCRAYAHFILVNIFCQHYNEQTSTTDIGIPYVVEPETIVSKIYDRETVASVYEKINRDIEEALPMIDDEIHKVPKYHFNRSAAYAFAARFNLYYHKDMQKVIDYATEALGDRPETMVRDFGAYAEYTGWADTGNGYINVDQPCVFMLAAMGSYWARCHGPYYINTRYTHSSSISTTQTYDSGGIWNQDWIFQAMFGSGVQRRCYPKVTEYFVITDPVNETGIPYNVNTIFSADETLLCRAEAYIYQNNFPAALADISIWNRSHGTPGVVTLDRVKQLYGDNVAYGNIKKKLNPKFTAPTGDQEAMIHCLLHVRRVETVGEGLRWFDIKRYGIEIEHVREGLPPITLGVDDPRRAIQLPQAVISAGMTPNPR